MIKNIFYIFSIILISCSSFQRKHSVELETKKVILPNGLTIILVKNNKLPIFSFQTFYRIGSKNEKKGMSGATHFLEHLMFKGAKKYGMGEFNKIVEGNGGSFNAYTSRDLTVYYENLPIKSLEKIIDLEADRMVNLLLNSWAFESERKVVLEERRMRYENSPYGQLYTHTLSKMFEKTPYEIPVIGSVEDIKNVTRDQIYEYFKKYYGPNNAIIVLSGDIEFDSALSLMKKYYAHLKPAPYTVKKRSKPYSWHGKKENELHLKGNSLNTLVSYTFAGTSIRDKKTRVYDILSAILGGGESSYFYQKYVSNKHPLMTTFYSSNYSLMHSGLFFFVGELLPGISSERFKEIFKEDLEKSCVEGVSSEGLDRIKKQILVSFYRSIEQNHSLASSLGEREVFHQDYQSYERELEEYQRVSVDDVRNACFSLLHSPKELFTTLSKGEGTKGQRK